MRIAGDSVAQASTNVSQLAGSVSEAIGGGGADVRNFTQQTGQAAEQLRKTLAEIEKIVGDPDVQLAIRQTVLKLPEVADNADNTLASITQAADSFQGAGTEAQKMLQDAGQTVQNLEQITRPFADRSESLADSIAVSLEDLDFTLKEVGVFSRRLNEGDGTLRRLLEDDELYWQVKRIVDNVELATVRVRPILDDARVISDKLARDPRQLGLKGALDKRPSGVGLK